MSQISQILLIDDEPKLIADILTAYGYNVTVQESGLAALHLLFEEKAYFDLIILDIIMPGIDGWAILKSIREDAFYKNIPIIMLTSMMGEDDLITGLARGADEYLIKPVTPKRLLAHINVIERRLPWCLEKPVAEATGKAKLLTAREAELLRHVLKGASNQQIANDLSISEPTVKNHLANIYKKLKVDNRTQAAFLAQKLNLI